MGSNKFLSAILLWDNGATRPSCKLAGAILCVTYIDPSEPVLNADLLQKNQRFSPPSLFCCSDSIKRISNWTGRCK